MFRRSGTKDRVITAATVLNLSLTEPLNPSSAAPSLIASPGPAATIKTPARAKNKPTCAR
jgi:hypothetical protein